ncbi:fungal-specific transcription factor domain-containing protein [Penicillium taxi]|uniref:fungal-specific transcription factor domain-containing protein n=1 Tax=Penicillium taxi TaxID=168475 RepID=UPI002544DD49|nr:fungal-specific transcription factor domain-containing protein [Penicillium taxi]KAJ5884653.1 fungal-specific transcription factor domain-containing protein [Penicillium taxi]
MALASVGHASEALRNAILAVSAFHKCGATAALPFKAKAVRSLASSLSYENASDEAALNSQLAASMMLCVYSVFDETEGNWHSYLNGARTMSLHINDTFKGKLCSQFLHTWLTYHEVLGAFSRPSEIIKHNSSSIDLLKDDNYDDSIVIGSLGCSLGVLDAIHSLNKMRCTITTETLDMAEIFNLERKLICMKQSLDPIDSLIVQNVNTEQHSRIWCTAELYRLAALLYHQRVCALYLKRHEERTSYLQQAFQILSSLKVCTSPWPLFVIASEAENDDQRLIILHTLDRMDEARKIGNVFVLRNIIQSFWKQVDLAAGCVKGSKESSRLNWWDILFLDSKTAVPWFI